MVYARGMDSFPLTRAEVDAAIELFADAPMIKLSPAPGLWPTSSTAAKPIGECQRCGGTRYENLVHHCGTAVKISDVSLFGARGAGRTSMGADQPQGLSG